MDFCRLHLIPAVQNMRVNEHIREKFDIKETNEYPPIYFNYTDINNISLELKLKLLDLKYNDYINDLNQYFYGIFFDKYSNNYIIRTHFRNLLLNEHN